MVAVDGEHVEEQHCINCCNAIPASDMRRKLATENCAFCGLGPVCGPCVVLTHMSGDCSGTDADQGAAA